MANSKNSNLKRLNKLKQIAFHILELKPELHGPLPSHLASLALVCESGHKQSNYIMNEESDGTPHVRTVTTFFQSPLKRAVASTAKRD